MEAFVSTAFSIIIYLFKQNSELTYALAPSFKIILQFGILLSKYCTLNMSSRFLTKQYLINLKKANTGSVNRNVKYPHLIKIDPFTA